MQDSELKDELKLYHLTLEKGFLAMDPNKVLRTVDMHRLFDMAWTAVERDRDLRHDDWMKRTRLDKILGR